MTGFLKCFKVNSFVSSILEGVRPEGPDKEISTFQYGWIFWRGVRRG